MMKLCCTCCCIIWECATRRFPIAGCTVGGPHLLWSKQCLQSSRAHRQHNADPTPAKFARVREAPCLGGEFWEATRMPSRSPWDTKWQGLRPHSLPSPLPCMPHLMEFQSSVWRWRRDGKSDQELLDKHSFGELLSCTDLAQVGSSALQSCLTGCGSSNPVTMEPCRRDRRGERSQLP